MMARVGPSSMEAPGGFRSRTESAVSLRYDEQAKTVEDVLVGAAIGGIGDYEFQEGEEARWIRDNIRCRECRRFVEDKDSSDEEDNLAYSKKAPPVGTVTQKHTDRKKERRPSGPRDKKCQCGYRLSQHRDPEAAMRNPDPDQEWTPEKHTSQIPTNSFGEIEFVGYGDKQAKYVRVDHETDMKIMLRLMMKKWGMEKPNLLISVTGGAKNFLMKARLKDAFRRGLMKAALSTGAWIITGGNNAGVMKHVGEAVRDYGLTAEGRVTAIGIAPWGCVQNKEVLICEESKPRGKWPASYRIQEEVKKKQSFLDPNHSHFILVDNGSQHKFGTEIDFRGLLEKEISLMQTNSGSDAVHVPVACLVLEGGPGTLKTVHSAISNNTPAIVIKGSGKCADVLAHAAQNLKETEIEVVDHEGKKHKQIDYQIDEKLQAEIHQLVRETFGPKNELQHVEWVKNCVQKPHLLTVFELESTSANSSRDVDMAILKALLKANKDQVMDQLKLALAWNRIDVAKSEIFTDERPWPTGALDHVMMSAIQLNRVSFVDLFLDNGVSLKDFLTVKRLLTLYNEIPRNCLLYTLLVKIKSGQFKHNYHHPKRKSFSLEDVGFLLQDLLGDYYEPHYLKDDKLRHINSDTILGYDNKTTEHALNISMTLMTGLKDEDVTGNYNFPRPAQELFLWSVLMNRQDLAKLFWREGNESTAAALVANSLLKAMKEYTDDTDMMHKLQTNADEFENLAVGVLNNCYSVNEQKAQDILVRELPHWGHATCVLIAVQADNKRFISQTACQSLLNSIWMGKMSQDNGLVKIMPSIFFFPLIYLIIKFQDEEKAKSEAFVPRLDYKKKDGPAMRPQTAAGLRREPTRASLKGEPTQANLKEAETEHSVPEVQYEPDSVPRMEKEAEKDNRTSCWSKISLFYTAPVVIFCLNCLAYVIFLGLYSYILLVQFSSEFHFTEGILIGWVFTIFVEELRQLVTNYAHSFRSKVTTYIMDSWNMLDIFTIFCFALGMILRFIPNDTCFDIARVILSINLVSFFFRILHMFSVNRELGPKLVMIRRMVRDLMWFVVILLVFIGAYAIASEAILFPNTELSWKLLYYLPRKAYWHIYGELLLDELEGTDTCTNDPALYSGYGEQRCPSAIGKYLVPIMMGIYILMTNVLLLNLLIAMFSFTFEQMQQNTDNIWRFMQLQVVMDYSRRPVLPPPLIFLSHLVYLMQWLYRHCCTCTSKNGHSQTAFRKRFENQNEEKQLIQWENIIADTYLTKVEASEAESVGGRLKNVVNKLEVVQTKVDDLSEGHGQLQVVSAPAAAAPAPVVRASPTPQAPVKQVIQLPPQLDQRLMVLEEQMVSTFRALNWIMQSMEASNMVCGVAKPDLPDPKKQKDAERMREKEKQQAVRKQVQKVVDRKIELHMASRTTIYPGTFIERFPVPDEKVPWTVEYEDYDPGVYTSDIVLSGTVPWADDVDLMSLSPQERQAANMKFNDVDEKRRVTRVSYLGHYKVVDGLPLNPIGRTGMMGRGVLGRWGPNIAGDPLITRWKYDEKGKCVVCEGKPVLEFIAVKRSDNKMWALPGAILRQGEQCWDMLTKYFSLEALGTLMDDPQRRQDIERKLTALSKKGQELYKGYADDARNTDNAWLETCVVNYHDDDGTILSHFELRAGPGTEAVSWLTVSSKLALHGSHLYFIKLAAEKHGAMF